MPGPTTEVLAEDLKDLNQRVSDLRHEFGEFRSEVRTQLGLIKWVGVFFAGILVALVTGAVTVAWNAATLTAEVKQQGGRLDAMQKQLDTIISRLPAKPAG